MRVSALYAACLIVGAVGGVSFYKSIDHGGSALHRDLIVPESGIELDPQGRNAVTNPENGRAQLESMYKAIVAYRKKTNALPKSLRELVKANVGLTAAKLENPDAEHADAVSTGFATQSVDSRFVLRRPDGSVKPAFPKQGERDVWGVSEIYVRRNVVKHADRSVSMKPQGSMLVLWSDGKISEVSLTDVRYYKDPMTKRWRGAFAGETGLPTGTRDWMAMHKNVDVRSQS